jgi:hypothetical protein
MHKKKHSKTQKGGYFGYDSNRKWSDWWNGTKNNTYQMTSNAENYLGNVWNKTKEKTNQILSTNISLSGKQNMYGGKTNRKQKKHRINKNKTIKGGIGPLGQTSPYNRYPLSFYATPVQGLKVVSPTYWVSNKYTKPFYGGKKNKTLKRS